MLAIQAIVLGSDLCAGLFQINRLNDIGHDDFCEPPQVLLQRNGVFTPGKLAAQRQFWNKLLVTPVHFPHPIP
jgi:hypothetical protein